MQSRWYAGIGCMLVLVGQQVVWALDQGTRHPGAVAGSSASAPSSGNQSSPAQAAAEKSPALLASQSARLPARAAEKLDRGLIARITPEGKLYLSWRLLETDPACSVWPQGKQTEVELPALGAVVLRQAEPSEGAER